MPVYRVIAQGAGEQMFHRWRRAVLRTVAVLLSIVGGLWVGLILLDGSAAPLSTKAFNALWNTANTLSTLGSLTDLGRGQRLFMIVAMLTVVSVVGYAISALTGILSRRDVQEYRENKRMEEVLSQLENHVVIVGFGPLGQRVAAKAQAQGQTVLVIDRDPDVANEASKQGHIGVQGSVSRDQILERVNIDQASALVITIEDPDRKMAAILMARALNPDIHIVATSYEQGLEWLTHAGASDVVDVDDLVAETLFDRMLAATASSDSHE